MDLWLLCYSAPDVFYVLGVTNSPEKALEVMHRILQDQKVDVRHAITVDKLKIRYHEYLCAETIEPQEKYLIRPSVMYE